MLGTAVTHDGFESSAGVGETARLCARYVGEARRLNAALAGRAVGARRPSRCSPLTLERRLAERRLGEVRRVVGARGGSPVRL